MSVKKVEIVIKGIFGPGKNVPVSNASWKNAKKMNILILVNVNAFVIKVLKSVFHSNLIPKTVHVNAKKKKNAQKEKNLVKKDVDVYPAPPKNAK